MRADPPVEIVGHWFDATRLDFRPERYWAPGTRITLRLRLKDVRGGQGRLRGLSGWNLGWAEWKAGSAL